MTNPTCETCRFFSMDRWENKKECRKHSPILYPIIHMAHEPHDPSRDPRYPKTDKHEWCGDHEPKETK